MSEIMNINYAMAQIQNHFDFLFRDGFRIAKIFDKLHFGNWIVVLRSENCIIRIIQDREQLSVEVGPPWASIDIKDSKHFTDLNLLVDFIENKEIIILSSRQSKLVDDQFEDLKTTLHSYYSQILSILNDDSYLQKEEEISLYHQKRIKKQFPNARFRRR